MNQSFSHSKSLLMLSSSGVDLVQPQIKKSSSASCKSPLNRCTSAMGCGSSRPIGDAPPPNVPQQLVQTGGDPLAVLDMTREELHR